MTKQKFFDVMIPMGKVKVVKILPSIEACPFCEGHTWFAFTIENGVIRPAWGSGSLVDMLSTTTNKEVWTESTQLDECTNCGAVCSI